MTLQLLTNAGIGIGVAKAISPDPALPIYASTNDSLSEHLLSAGGNFGAGATVTVEYTPDGAVTWIPITGIAFTVAGTALFKIPFTASIRGVVVGGTAPSVNLWFD